MRPLGYGGGRSCQQAPVPKIERLSTRRDHRRMVARPEASCGVGFGSSETTLVHWAAVRSGFRADPRRGRPWATYRNRALQSLMGGSTPSARERKPRVSIHPPVHCRRGTSPPKSQIGTRGSGFRLASCRSGTYHQEHRAQRCHSPQGIPGLADSRIASIGRTSAAQSRIRPGSRYNGMRCNGEWSPSRHRTMKNLLRWQQLPLRRHSERHHHSSRESWSSR